MGKFGGIILGVIFIISGLRSLLIGEYSSASYPWRNGFEAEGTPAFLIGGVLLLFGVFLIYTSITKKK